MLHIFGSVCYGSWRKFSCWNRRAFAVNLLMKWLPNAVATKELLNSTDEKSLVGQKPMGSQDTLTAAQTTRALWSRRFLPFSRSRDSCRYLKFEVICLSINLNFHWFTLFGNQQIFRCSPGPVPRFPNPQGHRFHDMVAKGNSASFEQALQELSQSKKRPFSVFFNEKHGRPWKNMFEKGCFQTFLGHKNDPWRQENGGVFFLPSQVMAMGLVRSWSPVRYCLTVGDITGVHSKQLCNSHFAFFLTAAPALCHASPSLGMYPIVQDGTNDIWFLKSKDSSYLTPGVSSDSLLQCWFWFAGDRMQISIPHLGKSM